MHGFKIGRLENAGKIWSGNSKRKEILITILKQQLIKVQQSSLVDSDEAWLFMIRARLAVKTVSKRVSFCKRHFSNLTIFFYFLELFGREILN